jgi:hypothetical protein
MTVSEFDTLRSDLSALRADMEARLVRLQTDMEARLVRLQTDMDIRFGRLEAKIDEKPGAGTIYQAGLATFAGMFAVMIGTIIALKTLGFIG